MAIGLSLLAGCNAPKEVAGDDRSLDFTADWAFRLGDDTAAARPDYNDADWRKLNLPHDWAIEGEFSKDNPSGTGGGALPGGIGWYRKTFTADKADEGKRYRIDFDGAYMNSTVYINGHELGTRPYGYISFSYDLTPYIKWGVENVLAVRVDNAEQPNSRWYSGCGIYRNVWLTKLNPAHIAQWGTYVTAEDVSKNSAQLKIRTKLQYDAEAQMADVVLQSRLVDADGNAVGEAVSEAQLMPLTPAEVEQEIHLKNPRLWSIDTPYMYRVESILKDKQTGEVLDRYYTPTGIRTFRFDAQKGFILNGEQVKINGVCMHHDLGCLGAAVNTRAIERQLEILKEMGCNAIRTSHNPPSIELLELCDKMGLMVQVEAFDEWKNGKCVNGYNTLFDKWAEKDLTDLIRRDRNHPCVIMWSIGNELREQDQKEGGQIARFLSDIVHREDPTRPSTAGYNNHTGAIVNGLADAVDLVGFNYKHYDYQTQHEKHPEYILYGSETSSAVSSRGVYKFPVKDNWTPWYNDYQVSSYDMDYVPWGSAPDTEFEKQDDNEFLLGEFVWTGFDYLGEPSPYGEGAPSRSSYFGIVDLAGLKKDRYYLYQSQWSNKPVLHVMPHWTWPDRLGQKVPIQCYTNYPEVELFVNGKSMGTKRKDKSQKFLRYRMRWDNIIYQPGEIKIIAKNEKGEPCEERIIKTAGNPDKIYLKADRDTLLANGKDLSFITVEIQDKEGNLCPRDASLLFVKVNGNGKLKALCNGDATDLIPFTSNYMRVFNGKMVIIVESKDKTGEINIEVSGERLKTSFYKLTCQQ